MKENILYFIQQNSPDGGFLQSDHWRKFQEAWGRKTHNIFEAGEDGDLVTYANVIEHILPIVGKYFYVPRGPIACNTKHVTQNKEIKKFIDDLIRLAKKNNVGWIRIEPASEEILKAIEENLPRSIKIKKSSVDMQPREILILDISKSEDEILAGMKQKARYNIKLAEKKGVMISVNNEQGTANNKYLEEFLRLVKITAQRDRITAHPEEYYRKMLEVIPSEILRLYIAEYEGKVIAANLVLFFGNTATYMHGASDNYHRNLMAPYLLQWQAIRDAKKASREKYDFGGVKTETGSHTWSGITKFKQGFAPDTKPIQFPGSYDIIVKPWKYHLYRILQKIKRTL